MVLTPDDVESQKFATAWRGYDRQEVDRFLDLAASALARLTRERDEAATRAEEVEREAADTMGAERLLKRTLVDAQRTADEAVAEARRTVEEMLAEARREAEAHRERGRAQVAGIRQAVEELHRFRSEYGEGLRAVLQRVGELPPLPPALDELVERTQSVALAREDAATTGGPVPGDAGAPPEAAGEDRSEGPVPPWR